MIQMKLFCHQDYSKYWLLIPRRNNAARKSVDDLFFASQLLLLLLLLSSFLFLFRQIDIGYGLYENLL